MPSQRANEPTNSSRQILNDTPPTAELHVHLEGTLEPTTIFEIAESNGLAAPAATVAELARRYEFNDLQSFLNVYYANLEVLRTAADFYAMTAAYLRRAGEANVRRAEMFFDPQSHVERGVPLVEMMEGITTAMSDHPEVSTGLIMCFLRHLGPSAAEHMYAAMAPFRDAIIGVGLDSTEVGYPNREFAGVFENARADDLRCVAHAGEEGGPDNVIESLDLLRIERIDHGVRSIDDPRLVDRLVRERIPLTVCPQSNVRLRVVSTMSEHPLKRMLALGMLVTVNSDDPAYFGGYIDDNYRAVQEHLELTADEVRQLARNSFDAAFLTDVERALHLQEVDSFYDRRASPQ